MEVSDHALVRYIERVRGESLEKFREEVRTLIAEHEGTPHPGNVYYEGFTFIIESHCERKIVVTILPPGFRKKKKKSWSLRSMIHVPMAAK